MNLQILHFVHFHAHKSLATLLANEKIYKIVTYKYSRVHINLDDELLCKEEPSKSVLFDATALV